VRNLMKIIAKNLRYISKVWTDRWDRPDSSYFSGLCF